MEEGTKEAEDDSGKGVKQDTEHSKEQEIGEKIQQEQISQQPPEKEEEPEALEEVVEEISEEKEEELEKIREQIGGGNIVEEVKYSLEPKNGQKEGYQKKENGDYEIAPAEGIEVEKTHTEVEEPILRADSVAVRKVVEDIDPKEVLKKRIDVVPENDYLKSVREKEEKQEKEQAQERYEAVVGTNGDYKGNG
jgi:hypothetical protein